MIEKKQRGEKSIDDHLYCKIHYVNVIQDYAGGGTYGTNMKAFLFVRPQTLLTQLPLKEQVTALI
jgi:hypothetical protein